MTNEKTNPMPYRAADAAAMPAAAGAAEAAGPDMAAPVITPDDVARGTELLRRYKDGKRALEARIIADEQWYRLRHWQYLRDRRREQGGDVVEPTSAWLFNAIVSKHADAMDSFPEAVILPRSEQDEPDAKALSAIVPAVLEKTHFEQVWSDAWWYKLKHGCAAYGVFWDSAGSNGLGDVAVRQLDLLNLFWEPGITDIQASRNLFVCALMDNDDISAAWPDARPGSCGVELAQYLYDDAVDTSNKSIVVDWYYKKPLPGGGTALHLIKFTGRDLLYASENDPAMAGGFYPHGQYPVVFDVLYPEAGTPCGFGMIAVSKDPQQYIDRLSGNLLEMSMKASTPRFWVKKGCGVNAQEFLDWSKPLVEVEGSIDDERLRQISLYNLDGQWVNMLQLKIDELKETSNSRDVTQGSVSGGVTAASAIAALQEAGSKSSRDTLRASYRAFERVVELVIELIRAYYTETRPFRVAAPGAQGYAFCTYSNAGLQARTVGIDADGMALLRAPAFDVSVHAQKESPYATASQNELARQLYQLGVFNPAFAQQAGRTLDTITREVLVGGDNVQYADESVSARYLLQGGNASAADNNYLTVDCIRRAVRALKNANCRRIDGAFPVIIHPDVAYDLMNDPKWLAPHQYVDAEHMYEGEIGKIEGCRFVESTEAKIFHAADLAGDSRTLLTAGAVSGKTTFPFDGGTVQAGALVGRQVLIGNACVTVTANTASSMTVDAAVTAEDNAIIYPGEAGAQGRDVYVTLVLGADGYGTTEITGGGLEHIVKQLGSAGTGDPLNQRASVGWKATKVAVRLDDSAIRRIETCSTYTE